MFFFCAFIFHFFLQSHQFNLSFSSSPPKMQIFCSCHEVCARCIVLPMSNLNRWRYLPSPPLSVKSFMSEWMSKQRLTTKLVSQRMAVFSLNMLMKDDLHKHSKIAAFCGCWTTLQEIRVGCSEYNLLKACALIKDICPLNWSPSSGPCHNNLSGAFGEILGVGIKMITFFSFQPRKFFFRKNMLSVLYLLAWLIKNIFRLIKYRRESHKRTWEMTLQTFCEVELEN